MRSEFGRVRRTESTTNSNASATSFAIRSTSDVFGLFAKALNRSVAPIVRVRSVGSSLAARRGSCSPNTSPIVAPSIAKFSYSIAGKRLTRSFPISSGQRVSSLR